MKSSTMIHAMLLLALAPLGGCVWNDLGGVGTKAPPPEPEVKQEVEKPPQDLARLQPPPDKPIRPDMPVPAKRPPRPFETASPTRLVGNSEGELQNLLGQPHTVRDEPPAMVWQYVSAACKVDVYFYFDVKTQGFRSLAYKFHPNDEKSREDGECLYLLQANARTNVRDER